MANGALHSMAFVAEATYGTTPATPTLTPVRHNTTSLGLSKDTLTSEELRSDRQIVDFRHGPKQIGGDISFEASYSSFDVLLEQLLGGTWDAENPASGTDRLTAGTTRRSLTMRRYYEDLESGNAFHVYTGVELNTMSLSITPSAMVTGTFGAIGQDLATQAAEISGATVSAASTTEPMEATGGSINEGGSPIAVVTELTLDLSNGMEPRFVVGSDKTIRPSIGRSNVSGQLTAYFEDASLLDKFIDETNSSVDVTLTDTEGNSIRIYLPNVIYTGGQPDVDGEGPITLVMPFQALYDTTEGTNIIIDRTPA